jgi:fermentation-respiration switch protein FrsA (DUF1100 family)
MTRMVLPISLLLVLLAGLVAALWAGQRRLMYFPDTAVPAAPTLGLSGVEPVSFRTADGETLQGWFFPVSAAAFTVIVFNGNAGNRAYRAGLAQALHGRGMAVLVFDYRGFGDSTGTPTEAGLYADARAARAYIARRPDVDGSRLVYLGESLGTAVAIDLATEHPPAALVLRSPFTSMADVGAVHYPMLPVRWLTRDRYASMARIGRVAAPVLVVAGDRDAIVPIEQSRRLYEAVPGRKAFVVVPGSDHNDEALNNGPILVDAIAAFIGRP